MQRNVQWADLEYGLFERQERMEQKKATVTEDGLKKIVVVF